MLQLGMWYEIERKVSGAQLNIAYIVLGSLYTHLECMYESVYACAFALLAKKREWYY